MLRILKNSHDYLRLVICSFMIIASNSSCKKQAADSEIKADRSTNLTGYCRVKEFRSRQDDDGNVNATLMLGCSDGRDHTQNVRGAGNFVVGDDITCSVSRQASEFYWSCADHTINFSGSEPILTYPSSRNAGQAGTNSFRPGFSGSPSNGGLQGSDGVYNGEYRGVVNGRLVNGNRPIVNSSTCSQLNEGNIDCGMLNLFDGETRCIEGKQWRCVNNCAVWLGDCGKSQRCSNYNFDGLTCEPVGLGEGQVGCKWSQRWACTNSCAVWQGFCSEGESNLGSGRDPRCRAFNRDGVTCGELGNQDGRQVCRWNQRWGCQDGCATWLGGCDGGHGWGWGWWNR